GTRLLSCSYRFEPGAEDDGVTIRIPSGAAAQLPLETADRQIPALLKDKVIHLLKGLPKEYRRQLIPIPQTVDTILRGMKHDDAVPLVTSLAEMIHKKFNVSIPAAAWPADSLPDYLKMRFAIVNEKGEEMRSARDIAELRGELSPAGEPAALKKAKKRWEREGITAWDFGDFPEAIDLEGGGSAYPALERGDEGRVAIRLFSDRERATAAHREGIAALYELSFKKEIAFLKKSLALPQDLHEAARACGGVKHIEQALHRKVMRLLFGRDIRTKEAFDEYAKTARQALFPRVQELLQGVIPVLRARGETDETLRRIESASRANRAAQTFIAALRGDIDRLMPEGFVECYDDERLTNIPRYLRAAAVRAERGITHLDKDAIKAANVRPFTDKLDEMGGQVSSPSAERRQAMEEYQWLVEEYKISVFAPEMKTARPVSPKRLQEKIGEIERMF
ncbi:MAG: DUF3418 domain-containing protein, partial [Syntrophaceae bacterium]|nr:DUF3418 domain-containing protein [Syntrophaceae bacterium]